MAERQNIIVAWLRSSTPEGDADVTESTYEIEGRRMSARLPGRLNEAQVRQFLARYPTPRVGAAIACAASGKGGRDER